jgi:hypothetical protein
MSEQLPPPPPPAIDYQTPPPRDSAPTLVHLAAIFNFVAVFFDALYIMSRVLTLAVTGVALAMPPPGGAVGAGPPGFQWIVLAITILPMLLTLLIAGVKVAAGVQMLRRGRGAWILGLLAGIGGVTEFWTCFCWIFSIAAGAYTIAILCLPNVRTYLTGHYVAKGFDVVAGRTGPPALP